MRSPATLAAVIGASTATQQGATPAALSALAWFSVRGSGSLRDTTGGATYTGAISGRGAPSGSWAVSQWDDLIGTRHLTQATAGLQPLIVSSQQNGWPCVRFDGVDDYLRSASFTAQTQPDTFWAVFKKRSTTSVSVANGLDSTHQHGILGSGGNVVMTASGSILAGPAVVANAPVILSCVFSNTSSSIRSKATARVTGAAGTQQCTGYTLGARYDLTSFGDVDFFDFAHFAGALTTAQEESLWADARSSYGIT